MIKGTYYDRCYKLFELNKMNKKSINICFSHIYIPNYQEEIYDKEIMIEKINIRFDNPNAMLENTINL